MEYTKQTKDRLLEKIAMLEAKNKKLEDIQDISSRIAEHTSDSIAICNFDLKAKYIYVSPSY